jgi:hypothetical protein
VQTQQPRGQLQSEHEQRTKNTHIQRKNKSMGNNNNRNTSNLYKIQVPPTLLVQMVLVRDMRWTTHCYPILMVRVLYRFHYFSNHECFCRPALNIWGHYAISRKVAGSSPRWGGFFNLPYTSSRTMILGSTQPLTKMSTRNFPRGKERPPRRADNLAVICEPNVCKCGSLNLSQP